MGIFDKIKGMVGSEDLDYNEYDGDLFGDDMPGADPMDDVQGGQAYDAGFGPFAPQPQPQPQPQRQQAPMGGSNLELKVVKPDRYENASEIADHLREKRTVVLNLESTNKDIARRLLASRSAATGRVQDIHEKSTDHLDKSYLAALYASDTLGWNRIRCFAGDDPRPIADIHAQIMDTVAPYLP